jgi:type IV fimbrial biogenesis protein FimT
MLMRPQAEHGFTLVEMLIAIAVLGILIMIGLPSMTTWIQNTQIRTHAETTVSGLQLARAEALKRNATVRFQFVNSLTASCALSTSGKSWVVSLTDPTGLCNLDPSETVSPMIIQKKDGSEGSPNTTLAAGASAVVFNGLGRSTGGNVTIDITNTVGGACGSAVGQMRCLQIQVTPGGQLRMCDPAVTSATDPRFC